MSAFFPEAGRRPSPLATFDPYYTARAVAGAEPRGQAAHHDRDARPHQRCRRPAARGDPGQRGRDRRELPPGRQQIKTAVRAPEQIERVYHFIDTEIGAGAQTYIVYPIIEESEKSNLKPLTIGFEATKMRFPNRRVAMIHGRMPPAESAASSSL